MVTSHQEIRIGISNEKLYCAFYALVYDVLIESDSVPLWMNGQIYLSTIVFLWLSLNYRLFCSGVTKVKR